MEHFSAWVSWRGPYYTKKSWVEAASSVDCHGSNACFRLYLALGCANALSVNDPRILYVGLNSRDAEQTLADEIRSKFESADKRLNGLFNEYWLGELLTQFAESDTPAAGVTKDTERSIIYALDPKQNLNGYITPPDFSFRVINELSEGAKKQPWFSTQFEDLVPSFIEYDAATKTLSHGTFRLVRKKRFHADKLKRMTPTAKKLAVMYWWERIPYEIAAEFNRLRTWIFSSASPPAAPDKNTYS